MPALDWVEAMRFISIIERIDRDRKIYYLPAANQERVGQPVQRLQNSACECEAEVLVVHRHVRRCSGGVLPRDTGEAAGGAC